MNKFLITFSCLLFLVSAELNAQWDMESAYGNINWVSDQVSPIRVKPTIGFRIRPSDDWSYRLEMKHPSGIVDSNAYSFMSYSVGSIANQRVEADLIRPINSHQHIEFDFTRTSNPGWLESSFARRSYVRVGFGDEYDRFGYSVQTGGTFLDSEMNGGLRGASYSISESNSATFNSLESDVYTTDAFRKLSDFRVKSNQDFLLMSNDSSGSAISLKNEISLNRFVSRFEDGVISAGLYSDLNTSGVTTAQDSAFYWKVSDEIVGEWTTLRDSIIGFSLQGGLIYEQLNFNQASENFGVQNIGYVARINADWDFIPFDIEYRQIVSGYNSGSYSFFLDEQINFRNKSADSSSFQNFFLDFDISLDETRVPLIFERYSNSLITNKTQFERFETVHIGMGLGTEWKKLVTRFDAAFKLLDGMPYFDESWNALQDTTGIELLTGEFELQYKGESLQFGGLATYQYNGRSRLYSFPEWIFQGNVDYSLPWLRDKMKITVGSYARYFSKYYARGYHALLDMPYVPSSGKYGEYLQVDGYIRFDIKTASIEIRSINSTYGLLTDDPLIGPGYSMPPRYFMATFSWRFKN